MAYGVVKILLVQSVMQAASQLRTLKKMSCGLAGQTPGVEKLEHFPTFDLAVILSCRSYGDAWFLTGENVQQKCSLMTMLECPWRHLLT